MTNNNKPKPSSRKRARKPDGKFEGGTELNEAWEPVELAEVVKEGKVDYSVRQQVSSTTNPTVGKYGQKPKIRPTFGNVTTTSY